MTIQDILGITEDKVYIMDEARAFAVIAKFTEDSSQAEVDYTLKQIYEMTVKDIKASDGDLILTVNTLEEDKA